MTMYLELTRQFNQNRLRAIISSGQAVVLHRVAMMSKDGDWIVREDDETTGHILSVLNSYKAHYRFSAPLDLRWLRYGWSAHFESVHNNIRVRIDLVSRPPRISNRPWKRKPMIIRTHILLWFRMPFRTLRWRPGTVWNTVCPSGRSLPG